MHKCIHEPEKTNYYCPISFNSHRDVTCDQLYKILVSISGSVTCDVGDFSYKS